VLRGNPNTIGSDIGFLPVEVFRPADARRRGIWHIDTYVARTVL
jgi:hypothetical protein